MVVNKDATPKRTITVAATVTVMDKYKLDRLAEKQGIKTAVMVRQWINERLAQETP